MADVTGYSMGGLGTYELGSRWPDLWARAFPIVGPPPALGARDTAGLFSSFRNVPVMAWYGQNDELVGPEESEQAFAAALSDGLRYDHWVFTPAGHITEGNNDEYGPAAAFFGANTVDRNPAHVTYYVDPSQDGNALSPANHAYWLSALTPRDTSSPAKVDAISQGKGVGDPPVLPVAVSAGTLNGGSHGPLPYHRRTQAWGPTPSAPKRDEIDLKATNLAAATIDPRRAGVSCRAKLNITSDGPIKVTLAGCKRTIS
jgi:hypothetical protein